MRERYEAYKDSGVEWIGEIPAGWEVRRIKSVASYERGAGIARGDVVADGAPCVRYGELYTTFNESIVEAVSHVTCEVWEKSIKAHDGDLVMSLTGETKEDIGPTSVNRSGAPIAVGGDALVVHPQCHNGRFLAYSMNSDYFVIQKSLDATGEIIIHLGSEKVGNAIVVLPPKGEQEAIADYLDVATARIDELVEESEREIELLQEYRKAVISEAVTKGLDPSAPMKDSGIDWIGQIPEGWEVVGFKTYLTGIVDYRGRTPEKVDEGVFLITGRNIKQGRIHYELSQEYMRPEDYDIVMGRGKLKVGNVLFTMEAPLGEVALIDRDDCAAAQRIVQLCCSESKLLGAFLVYWIMSDEFQGDLQTYATGSTASGIKASKLGQLRVVHPPVDDQKVIVDYLDAKTAEIDSLIADKQAMVDKLREYRKSLISEAVTGKFKVSEGYKGVR